jgi:hypothetical protein
MIFLLNLFFFIFNHKMMDFDIVDTVDTVVTVDTIDELINNTSQKNKE